MEIITDIPAAVKRPLPIEAIAAHQAAEREKDRAIFKTADELRISRELCDALLAKNAELEETLIHLQANAINAASLARYTIGEQQRAITALKGDLAAAKRQVKRRDETIDALMNEAICPQCEKTVDACIDAGAPCDRCAECDRLPKDCGCPSRCGVCRGWNCTSPVCRTRSAAEYCADEGRDE